MDAISCSTSSFHAIFQSLLRTIMGEITVELTSTQTQLSIGYVKAVENAKEVDTSLLIAIISSIFHWSENGYACTSCNSTYLGHWYVLRQTSMKKAIHISSNQGEEAADVRRASWHPTSEKLPHTKVGSLESETAVNCTQTFSPLVVAVAANKADLAQKRGNMKTRW